VSTANSVNVHEEPLAGSASDVSAPAANTAAQVQYAAGGSGVVHVIGGIAWSYSAAPTGGNLQISDGSNVIFNMDITAAGSGFIPFTPPKKGSANTALTVTLAAGGPGVSGKVSVLSHWTEGPGP
jgi:hypothetical protein